MGPIAIGPYRNDGSSWKRRFLAARRFRLSPAIGGYVVQPRFRGRDPEQAGHVRFIKKSPKEGQWHLVF